MNHDAFLSNMAYVHYISPCPMWADLPIQMFHSICNPVIHMLQNLFHAHAPAPH